MALTLRTTPTGAGNTLAALAFADAYFTERGNAAWTGADAVKESALINATDYIDAWFAPNYSDETLALEDVPEKLSRACCEYAVRALSGPLAVDPLVDSSGFHVVTTKKKVGPIEKEFRAQGNSSRPNLVRSYPAADILMVPFLKLGLGGTRVIR